MRLRNRDRFVLKTEQDPLAALGGLRAHTATKQQQNGGRSGEVCFVGDIPYAAETFELCPVCDIRNSWLPILRCSVAPSDQGSIITVEARCWWFTRVFMSVWYGMLTLFTVVFVLGVLLGNGFMWELLIVLVMWAWGFLLPHFAFWRPMNRAKQALCRILKGEITEG